MLQFLDFYGQKFRYMNVDNTNISYIDLLQQLGDVPNFIKMQDEEHGEDGEELVQNMQLDEIKIKKRVDK